VNKVETIVMYLTMQEVVPEVTHTSKIGKYLMAEWTGSASWMAVLLQFWHRLSLYLRFVEVLAAMVGLRVVLSLQTAITCRCTNKC